MENLMLSTTFQDLQIGLVQDTIQTKTFQKQLNLYLYIPPLSNIPSSCFKGLITVEVIHHWIQNSNKEDFINIATSFIQWLLQCGHVMEDLIPILQSAVSYIDSKETYKPYQHATPNSSDMLYLKWQFHPQDISKSTIHRVYNNTLQGHDYTFPIWELLYVKTKESERPFMQN